MGRKLIDISNQEFGNLIAVKPYYSDKGTLWECKCKICGNICYASGSDLRRGRTNYCSFCNKQKQIETPIKLLYNSYERGAINRGLIFDLTFEDFCILIKQNCNYCGSPPVQEYKKDGLIENVIYNGIDRVDNAIGYNKENCVTACKFCNFAKGKSSLEEFQSWIKRLIEYNYPIQ